MILDNTPSRAHCNEIPPEVLQELQGMESLDLLNLPIETIDL